MQTCVSMICGLYIWSQEFQLFVINMVNQTVNIYWLLIISTRFAKASTRSKVFSHLHTGFSSDSPIDAVIDGMSRFFFNLYLRSSHLENSKMLKKPCGQAHHLWTTLFMIRYSYLSAVCPKQHILLPPSS